MIEAAIGFLEEKWTELWRRAVFPRQTAEYLRLRIGAAEREVFTVIYLNNQHQVIVAEDMFHGTIDGAGLSEGGRPSGAGA